MLRIGDFSRLARVSIKALRHYDEIGLLAPAHVDRRTGYRYYAADQLGVLLRILALKDLGFSLDQVHALSVASGPALEAALSRRRAAIETEIATAREQLMRIDTLARMSGQAEPEIAMRSLARVTAYTTRARLAALGEVGAMFEDAERAVALCGRRAEASPFLLFHDQDYRDEDIDVEVCIPVEDGRMRGARIVEGSGAAGCVVFPGRYDQSAGQYARVLHWLDAGGLSIAGPVREVYHRFGADQRGYRLPAHRIAHTASDCITEIQVPVDANMTG